MGQTPVFTAVSYTPGRLKASWLADPPPQGFTGYVVTLTKDGVAELFPSQTSSTFLLNRTLDPTPVYTLMVEMQITGQPSVPSVTITLITAAPTLTRVNNNGTRVAYRWTAASGSGVGGYFAGLSSPATNWTLQTSASKLTAQFVQSLAGAGACTAWVRACSNDGIVLGPSSPVRTVITEAPTMTAISNRGTSVSYTWQAATGGGVEGYIATLSSPATNWNNPTNAQTLTTQFAQSLSGVGTCTGWVQAASADGVVLGPATVSRTLITEPPTLTAINNNGVNVVYRWIAAGGDGVEAYFVGLSTLFTDWTQSTTATVLTATFTQALSGLGTCTGWVCGSSADGVVRGPATPMRTLITEAPVMTLIDNSGPRVDYTWQAAGGTGVENYIATLSSPSTNWNSTVDAQTLTTYFIQTLEGLGACAGWVRGSSADGVILGPSTSTLTLITQPSSLGSLEYDSGQLGVVWTPASAGAVAYVATVAEAGQPIQSYPIGASGSGTAAVTLGVGGVYQVAVRATAPNLVGPPGNSMQPLTTLPGLTTLRAKAAGGFEVAWVADPDPRVAGYIAEFMADGSNPQSVGQATSPAAFPGTIASGVLYQGRVRATAQNLRGPWTALVNGPYQSSQVPAFDALGRLTGVTWDAGASVAYTLDGPGNIQTITWQ